jgi:hypothetical protein
MQFHPLSTDYYAVVTVHGVSNIYSIPERGIGQLAGSGVADCRLQVQIGDWGEKRFVGRGRRTAPELPLQGMSFCVARKGWNVAI